MKVPKKKEPDGAEPVNQAKGQAEHDGNHRPQRPAFQLDGPDLNQRSAHSGDQNH